MSDSGSNSDSLFDDDLVVSSSLDVDAPTDEPETEPFLVNNQNLSNQSIKGLILKAKTLLTQAEVLAHPIEHHGRTSPQLYGFSDNVTASDILKESVFSDILNICQRLKGLLCAERILSLGCPQLPRERHIFDELLLTHGQEFLIRNIGNITNVQTQAASTSNQEPTLPCNPLRENSDIVENRISIESVPSTSSLSEMPGATLRESLQDQSEQAACQSVLARESLKKFVDNVYLLLGGSSNNIDSQTLALVRKLEAFAESMSTLTSCNAADNKVEKNSQSPRNKKRKVPCESTEEKETKKQKLSEEEECCPICLEAWSTGGEHRITCLKCGHLFGMSCIEKWVAQAHACPQCKAPAKKSDIRPIFVTNITAEDTSERDRALRLLEEERVSRRQMEQSEALTRKNLDKQLWDMKDEIVMLQARLQSKEFCSSQASSSFVSKITIGSTQNSSRSGQFSLKEKISICSEPSCRVFDFCSEMGVAVVSQKSPNAIFKGFGVKILSREFRPMAYHPLHASMIRDLSFQPGSYDGLLLSSGMDKCVMLTSITSKAVVQKYNLDGPVWCCTWNPTNTNLFYAGMGQGVVKEFDLRRTDTSVRNVIENGGSPVTSLQYMCGEENENDPKGLLIGHQQNLIFKEPNEDQLITHRLPYLQAPLMSLSLHSSGKFLTSFRPGSSLPRCRHEVSQLVKVPGDDNSSHSVTAVRLGRWEGGAMQAVITRNSLMSHPDDESLILAVTANHASNKINVWDLQSQQEIQSLGCHNQKILDIKPLTNMADSFAALTDKDFMLYKWR